MYVGDDNDDEDEEGDGGGDDDVGNDYSGNSECGTAFAKWRAARKIQTININYSIPNGCGSDLFVIIKSTFTHNGHRVAYT